MPGRFANRVGDAQPSDIRRMSAICQEQGGINLSQGVCDQPAPEPVKAAAKHAIDQDHAIYTHLAGIRELRVAIAGKMAKFNGITADPDREIVVATGSAGAFFCVAMVLLEPGDEVVLFSPFYNYYVDTLRLFGVTIRFVDTKPPDWQYSSGQLASVFTERTKLVLVNTPCNPTGKVFTEAELHEIAVLAKRFNAWIVADEVYEYITYGAKHVSIGRLPEAAGRTITLSGASKTYAVTGWRVGYAVGPAELIHRVGVVGDLIYICAPSALQYGVTAGLELPESYYTEMADEYRRKRDLLVDTLESIGWTAYVPEGAFYLMADFGDRYADGVAAADEILKRVGVAMVPAASFYRDPHQGKTQLRFCFAKQMNDLEAACQRLRRLA
ncbi:MAG: aminotransferase class I/II-fold pyridoxal phosphate-dependent enzyme [Phycisphaerae bacterium]|nr:aminotransferase class I/II-fold pyridoxal phosphate-dependent enzyme [Phycisphaerae bacterium]